MLKTINKMSLKMKTLIRIRSKMSLHKKRIKVFKKIIPNPFPLKKRKKILNKMNKSLQKKI
jgi:hypothetical protein